ncbi:MAG TPA: (Fe-S)-binding protein [Candidatus Thermoplasmatota archaeon]|nr:(Fe-S)-binding protein [Candidatus Thermoplasmatota archaeon]
MIVDVLKKSCVTTMVNQTDNNNVSNTQEFMTTVVSDSIKQCIQCHRCMDVCPVTKGLFSITELNQATQQDSKEIPAQIKAFAFNCMQCGKCVPVCPVNIRRDYMVRYIKFKLKGQKPWSYTRYLFIKGPDLSGLKGFMQKLYITLNKKTTRDLASFMETTPVTNVDVLFYPGCYIYSKKTVRQTLRFLDHLGSSYGVLGGVTACCGAPHLLQGEFEEADHCLEALDKKIKTIDPKIIITSCAECFEAIEQIKKSTNATFEVLSVVQYLLRNIHKFPNKRIRGKILIHDSCRFNKESPQGIAARTIAMRFGDLVKRPETQQASCCYQWNHGHDSQNSSRRTVYLAEVKKQAPTLACTCLTCLEELKKINTSVEIIDVAQLFEDALNADGLKEQKP